jgi:hypothetical protein
MALSTKAPDDLQIHAIAWAPLAENRIAVINGHVVREGAFVEGVEIVGIEMDEVIVRRGERQWRLRSK